MEASVLAFAFFAVVFATFTWLIYIFGYVSDKLGGAALSQLGLLDFSIYTAIAVLPILILWMIFGYVNQYLNFNQVSKHTKLLFQQMKKNLDYTDLLARILLEAEQEIKNSFILNKFELFIADMNELLAETIQRGSLASPEQIDRLWHKVRDGGKWAFGKVIIEVSANQPNFGPRLVAKANSDTVLGGTILEFCARYQNLLALLEKHDKEKVFLSVIETGVYGKVYSILAPLGEQVRKARIDLSEESGVKTFKAPVADTPVAEKHFRKSAPELMQENTQNDESEDNTTLSNFTDNSQQGSSETPHKKLFNIFNPFKARSFFEKNDSLDEDMAADIKKDPFSIALERSFGSNSDTDAHTAKLEPDFSMTEEKDDKDDFRIHHFEDTNNDEGMPAPVISARQDNPDFQTSATKEDKPLFDTRPSRFETENGIGFNNTQKALNSLKKEWQELKNSQESSGTRKVPEFLRKEPSVTPLKQVSKQNPADDDYAYPFGGWSNAENYDNK